MVSGELSRGWDLVGALRIDQIRSFMEPGVRRLEEEHYTCFLLGSWQGPYKSLRLFGGICAN